MKKSARRGIFAAASAALAVSGVLAATLVIPAEAEDGYSVAPDAVSPVPIEQLPFYTGTGRVGPTSTVTVDVPGFGTFGFDQNYVIKLQNNYQEFLKELARMADSLSAARAELQEAMPDAALEAADPSVNLVANQKFENGSEVVDHDAPPSSSSPVEGTTYQHHGQGADGQSTHEYQATARIDGNQAEVYGRYTIQGLGMGEFNGYGNIGFSLGTLTWPEGVDLGLSGHMDIFNADQASLSFGPTSVGVGLQGHTKDGDQVGVSVAVGRDGVKQLSVTADVDIPGVPGKVGVRADFGELTSGGITPVPGLEFSGDTTGTFRLTLDVNVFFPWFQNAVK